jgi:hypothetical protein
MGQYGDMTWAAATRGEVRGMERFAQIARAIRFQIADAFRSRPREIGLTSAGEIDRLMREVELPATPLVAKASALVTELGPPALTGHVLRTWAWGVILGQRDGLAFDREAFALAALLHDVALSRRTRALTCFADDGAQQAVAALSQWGAPEALQQTVGNAICLHLRVTVPAQMPEAHLVHAGAAVDVLGGKRFYEIPPELQVRVLARHPRLDLKRVLTEMLRKEHAEHPRSRAALWVSLGFVDAIHRAPFSE